MECEVSVYFGQLMNGQKMRGVGDNDSSRVKMKEGTKGLRGEKWRGERWCVA